MERQADWSQLPAKFFDKFADSFDPLFLVLGQALLASYLLALEQVGTEAEASRVEFADPVEFGFDVPPAEALDYFRNKRIVRREEFDDLTQQARAGSFTVSYYREDVLESFKEEIARSLERGTPQRETLKRFRAILDGAGHRQLGAFHLETVYRTNMQVAYGTGRRRALEEVAEDLPIWQYNAVLDDRTRPTHRSLDGIVFPADHEFWNEHFPPIGFNCRCSVTALPSMPDGYDASNPSGEAQLVYDKRGFPAKAEYGTSVIDLGVSKFPGVPSQGRLREVIEESAQRARQSRPQTPEEVLKKEDEIRFKSYEHGAFFDGHGKILLEKKGRKDYVEFDLTDEDVRRLRGSTFTHNQPPKQKFDRRDPRWKGESFSPEDVKVAAELELLEARAVTFAYQFSIRPPRSGWNEAYWSGRIEPAVEMLRQEVLEEFQGAIDLGEISIEQAEADYWHEVWKRAAKHLRLQYKREER